nr:MAG TPA: hypothetical protein [Bacteriophage sp.]
MRPRCDLCWKSVEILLIRTIVSTERIGNFI